MNKISLCSALTERKIEIPNIFWKKKKVNKVLTLKPTTKLAKLPESVARGHGKMQIWERGFSKIILKKRN